MDRHIVIVDPLSTGRELAPAFAARGVKAIAVLSNVVIAPTYIPSWEPENFDLILGWNGTDAGLEQLVATLTPFAPIAVIAGAEIGVILGDRLGARLAPATGNDPATSLNRRDKGDMGSAVAAAGIPALRQLCTADPEAAAAWIGENGLDRARLVLKPSNSSLTDEVHFVEPGAPWRPAFDRILASTNALGLRNTQVLVQEFAEGVEYIVDLYSVDGAHGLVDVCRYTKASRKDSEGGHRIGIYERVDFLPPDSPEIPDLFDYAKRVADAVGIRNGSAHAEIMLTPAGPRLLEIAARPAGGGHQGVCRRATGDCQIDRVVRHLLDGEFRPGFGWIQHVRAAFLAGPVTGVWRNGEIFDQVDGLPTVYRKVIKFATGDRVPQTTGLADALGWVEMADADEAAIDADYLKIKELEASMIVD
ncbi:ATP-grasp domain-containing protein [Catenulispora yoronensis]|uniref:ATP-grasp domain-containing protein n=1 Tax=Catenulispora yoronensis TaxID=450799 RepID=A0ABP5G1E1_9ACTN